MDVGGCTDRMVLFSTGESLVYGSLASLMRFPRGVPEALWGLFGFFPPQPDPLGSHDKVSLQSWVMVQPGPESAPLGDHEAVVSLGLASVRGQGCDGFHIWKVRLKPLHPTCGPGKPCILRFFGHWACQQALVVRVELGGCFHQPLLTQGKRQAGLHSSMGSAVESTKKGPFPGWDRLGSSAPLAASGVLACPLPSHSSALSLGSLWPWAHLPLDPHQAEARDNALLPFNLSTRSEGRLLTNIPMWIAFLMPLFTSPTLQCLMDPQRLPLGWQEWTALVSHAGTWWLRDVRPLLVSGRTGMEQGPVFQTHRTQSCREELCG